MKKMMSVLGIFVVLSMFGCSENDTDNSVYLGDRCNVAEFKDYCINNDLVYCRDSTVKMITCDEVCASLNGDYACRYNCNGTKVGDKSYNCKYSHTLVETVCVQGDNNLLLGLRTEYDCSTGNGKCVVEGTSASCQQEK